MPTGTMAETGAVSRAAKAAVEAREVEAPAAALVVEVASTSTH